jgi:hypothetical protein
MDNDVVDYLIKNGIKIIAVLIILAFLFGLFL